MHTPHEFLIYWKETEYCLQARKSDICVMHDDLGWTNRTKCYNRFAEPAICSRLEYVDILLVN